FDGWHVDNSYEGRLSGPDKLANVKLSTPNDARGPAVQSGLSWVGWDKFANIQLRGQIDKFGTVWGPKLTSDPFSAKEGENLNVDWRWYRKNITTIGEKDVLHGRIILTN